MTFFHYFHYLPCIFKTVEVKLRSSHAKRSRTFRLVFVATWIASSPFPLTTKKIYNRVSRSSPPFVRRLAPEAHIEFISREITRRCDTGSADNGPRVAARKTSWTSFSRCDLLSLKTKTRFFSVVLAAIVCRNAVVWSNLKIKKKKIKGKKKEREERDEISQSRITLLTFSRFVGWSRRCAIAMN